MSSHNTSETGTDLEERRFQFECQIKNREISIKERELAIRNDESNVSKWLNPTVIGLFAAATGLVGNLVVAFIGNQSGREIERNREQSSIIIQAVSTGNAQAACKNLRAFIKLGLLDDPKGTLGKCESALDTIPVLPGTVTYTPKSDIPNADVFATTVTRNDEGNKYRYAVSFSIPNGQLIDFNLIKIYAIQRSNLGQRELDMPDVSGSWTAGDRVHFSAEVPKEFVENSAYKAYLRFCVGSEKRCLPGPNLALPQGE